jgi:hypothetical protein
MGAENSSKNARFIFILIIVMSILGLLIGFFF